MAIIFETLDELIAFLESFEIRQGSLANLKPVTNGNRIAQEKQPKLKPYATKKTKIAKSIPEQSVQDSIASHLTLKTPVFENNAPLKPSLQDRKNNKARVPVTKLPSLTKRIQNAINTRVAQNQSFTATDIYNDLITDKASSDPINKQSVITSVLKQMNSTYADIEVEFVPGNGPRPVKLYNPQQ
ncbi:MAG: hypothetical protein AAGI66_05870 [Cyanobacteria bacterium P01_H01_bin.74]